MIELTLAVVVKCFCCSVRKLKMASFEDMMCSSDSEKRSGMMTTVFWKCLVHNAKSWTGHRRAQLIMVGNWGVLLWASCVTAVCHCCLYHGDEIVGNRLVPYWKKMCLTRT